MTQASARLRYLRLRVNTVFLQRHVSALYKQVAEENVSYCAYMLELQREEQDVARNMPRLTALRLAVHELDRRHRACEEKQT